MYVVIAWEEESQSSVEAVLRGHSWASLHDRAAIVRLDATSPAGAGNERIALSHAIDAALVGPYVLTPVLEDGTVLIGRIAQDWDVVNKKTGFLSGTKASAGGEK